MTLPPPLPVTIDIVSDVVCPWCYIGKRRLEAALAARPDVAVTLRWHPFQLDPTIPPGGLDRRAYMRQKFGSDAKVAEINARVGEAAQAEGLVFALDRIPRAVNTLDAHRVLHWAGEAGQQDAMAEALFRAYFSEGRDLGAHAELAIIAGTAGLDAPQVAADLATDRDVAAIQSGVTQAVRIGVSGVPFFIFAQSFAVSGAQAPEVLAAALDKARQEGGRAVA